VGGLQSLFAGSERGAERAAVMYTLVQTCLCRSRHRHVDPQAWLADVLAAIADTPPTRLAELLPWIWKREPAILAA